MQNMSSVQSLKMNVINIHNIWVIITQYMFGTKSKNKRHYNPLHWVIITQYMFCTKSKNKRH